MMKCQKNIKRLRAALLALFMALSIGMMCGGALAATHYTGTTTSMVNVRSGPSTKATVIKKINGGTKVTLSASVKKGTVVGSYTADMNFYKLASGGYIAAGYIKDVTQIASTSTPASTPAPSEDLDDSDIPDEDTQDIDDSDDEGTIDLDEGDVDGADDDMELTEVTDEETDTASTEGDSSQQSTGSANTAKMTVTTDALNVRSSPSTSATSLRKLSRGATVTITASYRSGATYNGSTVSGNWYKLDSGGFVSADYLKQVTDTTINTTTSSSKTVSVTVATAKSDTTMYSKPMTLASKMGTLKKGSSKEVSATYKSGSTVSGMKVSGTWYKLSNGYYVQSGSVTVSTDKKTVTTNVTVTTTTLVVGDVVSAKTNVNLRKGPGTSYAKTGTMIAGNTDTVTEVVQHGEKVDGKAVSDSWVKLRNSGAYVRADFLKLENAGSSAAIEEDEGTDPGMSQEDIDAQIPEE